MTPAEEAVLVAARAYSAVAVSRVQPSAVEVRALTDEQLKAGVCMERLLDAAMALQDAPAQPEATGVAVRPWPDPEAYKALARDPDVFGEAGPPKEVGPAVAAWKALQDGQRVMCARGYLWTCDRATGVLRFVMARKDGRPGKVLEQPWYPLITARLPVWPIVVEAAD